jgi:hypothetical protein
MQLHPVWEIHIVSWPSTTTMAQNKCIKTMVQVLDENFLLSGTGSSTGSESGRAENTEIDQSGHSSQEGDGEDDDDEDDNEEEDVVGMPSPPPTVTKKRRRGLKKDKHKERTISEFPCILLSRASIELASRH